jgi:hypothetical protein
MPGRWTRTQAGLWGMTAVLWVVGGSSPVGSSYPRADHHLQVYRRRRWHDPRARGVPESGESVVCPLGPATGECDRFAGRQRPD